MKKMLAILGTVSLVTTPTILVVGCGTKNNEFQDLKNVIDATRGEYQDNNAQVNKAANGLTNVIKQSSSAVIYLGAKDNWASRSFEEAMKSKQLFEGTNLHQAEKVLSEISKVSQSEEKSVDLTILAFDIEHVEFSIPRSGFNITPSDYKFFRIMANGFYYDAAYRNEDDGQDTFKFDLVGTDATQFAANNDLSKIINAKITGFKIANDNKKDQSLQEAWQSSLDQWMNNENADKGIGEVQMNTGSDDDYGKFTSLDNQSLPFYGIKSLNFGIKSAAYTFAKPQLTFKAYTFDKVSDYWNNDLFKSLLNDYIKPDLMLQVGANEVNGQSNSKDILDRLNNPNMLKPRQKLAKDIVSKIKETKGPLFLIIKNGHLIRVQQGWNTYSLGFDDNKSKISETAQSDFYSWTKELTNIFSQSTANALTSEHFVSKTFDSMNWTDADAGSTWDVDKDRPTKTA